MDSLHHMRGLRKLDFTSCIKLYGSQTKLELALPECECIIGSTNCSVDDVEEGWHRFVAEQSEHI